MNHLAMIFCLIYAVPVMVVGGIAYFCAWLTWRRQKDHRKLLGKDDPNKGKR